MKKRMLRALSFILAICMVVISVDMPVVAVNTNTVIDCMEKTTVLEDDIVVQPLDNNEETQEDVSEEDNQVIENSDITEEVETEKILIQQNVEIVDYDDVIEIEFFEISPEDIEGNIIDADELLSQYEEAPIFYATEESYDWDRFSNYYI